MNKVRPLTFGAHNLFNRLQMEKSELMKRMLTIDQELNAIVNSFGYKIEVEEVEEYVSRLQEEYVLRLAPIGSTEGEVLGIGVLDDKTKTWSFVKDSGLKDPMLIASIECMIERKSFLDGLGPDKTTGVFFFSKDERPLVEHDELPKEAKPKTTPIVEKQPDDRKLAKPVPTAPQPVSTKPIDEMVRNYKEQKKNDNRS